MKKVELYDAYYSYNQFRMYVIGKWARLEINKGKELKEIAPYPNGFHISFGNMILEFEDGHEVVVPLTEFYSDEKDQPDLKMLWHSNYWDGMLSGLALLNGEKVWIECFKMCDNDDRIFKAYRLTPDVLKRLEYWHNMFRELVGHHCDYGDAYDEAYVGTDQAKFFELYDPDEDSVDVTQLEWLGTFTDCQIERSK